MIMTKITATYFLMILCIGCIPVASIESKEKRRSHHGHKALTGADSLYQSVNYDILSARQYQIHWQRQKRKLTSSIDEVVPMTKQYGSVGEIRQSKSTNGNMSRGKGSNKSSNSKGKGSNSNGKGTSNGKGKGNGSNSNGKGTSKGNGKGKGENRGKGENDNMLPMICYNSSHGTEGKMGKGYGSASKSKTKGKKSLHKSSKAKSRRLKGVKGKEKSEKRKKGKGDKKNERCSKFESGQILKQRTLYDIYASNYANLLDTAREIPEISVFVSLLYRYDLNHILECEGPFTALIPTNEAFNRLDPIIFADLLLPTSRDKVEQLILNHVFSGFRAEADFMEGAILSLSGNDVTVNVNPLIFNNDATAETPDIFGSNGVLHLIDGVLLVNNDQPPNTCDSGEFDFEGMTGGQDCMMNVLEVACSEPELSIFLTLIEAANLQNIFTCSGPFTVLAPTNEAFDGLSIDIDDANTISEFVLFHVLPGLHFDESIVAGDLETLLPGSSVTVTIDPVRFNNATVLASNIDGCNGIVYILDSILALGNALPGMPSNAPILSPVASIRPSMPPNLSSISPSPSSIAPFMLQTMEPSELGPNLPTMLPNISSPSTPTVSPMSIPSAIIPSTAPTEIPISGPNAAIPSLGPTASPILVPSATMPTFSPTIFPLLAPNASMPPSAPTDSPIAGPNGTIRPSGPTIQPTVGAQTPLPSSDTSDTLIPSDLPSLSPNKATNSPLGTSPVSPTDSPIAGPNDSIRPSAPTIQPTVDTQTPSVTTTTLIPSDLPSLTPSKATKSPIGTSPVSSTQPTPSSPNTNQPAIAPSTTAAPIETLPPSTAMVPTATDSPTESPSVTLNTTTPTSMGSDMPSLMPQSNSASPIVTMTIEPTALTIPPSVSPTDSELRVDLNETFYIAFISDSDVEPTDIEYEQMRSAIEEYYDELIRTTLMTTDPSLDFIRIEMYLNSTQHNAGIPDDRFNIYMEFTTAIAFFAPNGTDTLITSDDLLGLLLDGITPEFLLDPVRMQTGTPFADVTEAFLQTLP